MRNHESRAFGCPHCTKSFPCKKEAQAHLRRHEDGSYPYGCLFNDASDCKHDDEPLGARCAVQCDTLLDMNHHIQHCHTASSLATRYSTETQLAQFFDTRGIPYDRDWVNRLNFKGCSNMEGNRLSARPDFYLPTFSAELGCVVLCGNDEMAHRHYPCEFQRIWNIAHSLQQVDAFRDVPLLYIRFNPHRFRIGKQNYECTIEQGHAKLLQCLSSLTKSDIRPGVNLIYIQYDRDETGRLRVFSQPDDDQHGGTHYRDLYESCVIRCE